MLRADLARSHTPTALLDDPGADLSYPSLAYAFAPLYAHLAKASELSSVECVEHECTVHCESEQGPRDHSRAMTLPAIPSSSES